MFFAYSWRIVSCLIVGYFEPRIVFNFGSQVWELIRTILWIQFQNSWYGSHFFILDFEIGPSLNFTI